MCPLAPVIIRTVSGRRPSGGFTLSASAQNTSAQYSVCDATADALAERADASTTPAMLPRKPEMPLSPDIESSRNSTAKAVQEWW